MNNKKKMCGFTAISFISVLDFSQSEITIPSSAKDKISDTQLLTTSEMEYLLGEIQNFHGDKNNMVYFSEIDMEKLKARQVH